MAGLQEQREAKREEDTPPGGGSRKGGLDTWSFKVPVEIQEAAGSVCAESAKRLEWKKHGPESSPCPQKLSTVLPPCPAPRGAAITSRDREGSGGLDSGRNSLKGQPTPSGFDVTLPSSSLTARARIPRAGARTSDVSFSSLWELLRSFCHRAPEW